MTSIVLAISVLTLWANRETAIEHAHDTSKNVAAVLASHISRTVESADQSLQTLIGALDKPGIRNLDPQVRHDLLFSPTASARYVTGMGVTDDKGQLVDGCCSLTHRWDFSDRDYFIVHRDHANVGLYVSGVYKARSRAGVEAIALSRRMDRRDGTFAGTALVAIDLDYFKQLLEKLDVGPRGVTAIVRTDGTLLARNPPPSAARAPDLNKSLTFPRMVNQESGFYVAPSSSDGVLRLYTFQRVPGTPFIAVVAPAMSDALAPWQRLSWIVGLSSLSVSLAFCAGVWLLAFALRGRVMAEKAPRRLAALFDQLAARWRAETHYLSSSTQIATHPAYQRIIGLGPQVIPLILADLARKPDPWFRALAALTGEAPVAPADRGRLPAMADAWLAWCRANGWIA